MPKKKTASEPLQAAINIGVVGHVDHGKTSLTKALTGTWTDTHSEELKKGISIRLGYADAIFRKCNSCKGAEAFTTEKKCSSCDKATSVARRVSFVDAPGHETLMTTMLSGAALMHGAILVVAANEKAPQPRTAEHLMALQIAGIKNIIVAQNKIDLVDQETALKNYKEIETFLADYDYKDIPIIPTAAHFGTNIDLLIEAIEEAIPTPAFDEKKTLKMYVARSFDINKPGKDPDKFQGAVFGGTIMQGKAIIGEKIELLPKVDGKKLTSTIASLSTSSGKLEEALPGGLIAVGTLLDPLLSRNDQMRGKVLGKEGTLSEESSELSMEFYPLKRLLEDLKNTDILLHDTLILTVGTATTIGTVTLKKKDVLAVALKAPVLVEKGNKVALSKKLGTSWRLVAYGIIN